MTVKITDGFESGDDEKVLSIINKWKGGTISDRLFAAISKMTVLVSAITVVFRKEQGLIKVLLLRRSKDDPTWPGQLNLPGSMFRPSDFKRNDGNPVKGPFERIQKDEIKAEFNSEPKFAGIAFQDSKRGPIVALTYIAKIPENINSGEWIWADTQNLNSLKDLLEVEHLAIETALKNYPTG